MPSLAEMLKNSKAKAAKAKADNAQQKEITLRGTGLTKKAAAKSGNAYDRAANKAMTDPAARLEGEKARTSFLKSINEDSASLAPLPKPDDFQWDQSQLDALEGLEINKYGVLIGSAGTGKTTVTQELVDRLTKNLDLIDLNRARMRTINEGTDENPVFVRMPASNDPKAKPDMAPAIAFAAYTGIAMQQMKKALDKKYHKNCSTIHSLLGYAPEEEEYMTDDGELKIRKIFRPSYTSMNKLPYKIYVFDEAGMIPINLWNEFIDACEPDARIFLIGDMNQLPPVHGKGVLGFAMNKWPVFELTKIHRQAADNPIIGNAHKILNGRPDLAKVDSKFNLVNCNTSSGREASIFLKAVIKRLTESGSFDPIKHTIIVPKNSGPLGRISLNEQLVTFFNPEREKDGIIVNKRINIHTGTEHVLYAVGDKVMVLQNDHNRNLTNGMTGVIQSINLNGKYDLSRSKIHDSEEDHEINFDESALSLERISQAMMSEEEVSQLKKEKADRDQRQASHVVTIKFSNGEEVSFNSAGEYRKLTHAYAATCHKSQGSEYGTVIIMVHSADNVMLTREWLYTAVTRAKERVVLVYNSRGLEQALGRQAIKGRTLEEKIKAYQNSLDINSEDDVFEEDWASIDRNKTPVIWERALV